jgi:integrase
VIARYEAERMPTRYTTARVYRAFLRNHIVPKWGDTAIQAVEPRPVELWLRELPLSPKSKTHVRSLMHGLVEFAMWAGVLKVTRNPISLVQSKGAMRRVHKPRSLSAEQFHALLKELHEPFGTMALLSVCLGLKISEALALQWGDVDWLGSTLTVQRGIVNQRVDDVKTKGSARTFQLTPELLDRLKTWRHRANFSEAENWIFASPIRLGRLHIPTRAFAVNLHAPQPPQTWDTSGRIPSGTPTAHRCCGHSGSRATEDDAPRGHTHHIQYLWGCCNG